MRKPLHKDRSHRVADERALARRLREEAAPFRLTPDGPLQARIMQAVDDCRIRGRTSPRVSGSSRWLLALSSLAAAGAIAAAVLVLIGRHGESPPTAASRDAEPNPKAGTVASAATIEWPTAGLLVLDVVTTRKGMARVAAGLDTWGVMPPESVRLGDFDHDAQAATQLLLAPLPWAGTSAEDL